MRSAGQSVGCNRKKIMLVAAAPHKARGALVSLLRSAISLLALFAVAVPAVARKLDETLTLPKAWLRPAHFIGGDCALWPMTTNWDTDQ